MLHLSMTASVGRGCSLADHVNMQISNWPLNNLSLWKIIERMTKFSKKIYPPDSNIRTSTFIMKNCLHGLEREEQIELVHHKEYSRY